MIHFASRYAVPMTKTKKQIKPRHNPKRTPTVSELFDNGHMLEMLYAPRLDKTTFAYWDTKTFNIKEHYKTSKDETLVPVKASNNLIKHGVVKFPSYIEECGGTENMITEIKAFIHKYVDLEPDFETIAAYYVLLTAVYDRFKELPYLRLIGDYGTGKTRFLLIVGSICYKPIFSSGASTISPIFHSLDSFRGTLILDEADFRFSGATSEITKILNNGNVKGFPVLRCEGNSKGEYNPRAFQVFGPKIIATRGHYSDPALESRFIYERTKSGKIRKDIPINLPDSYEVEADSLQNKLLMFRFKNWHTINPDKVFDIGVTENRIAQIYRPLLALTHDEETRNIIIRYAQKSQSFLKAFRSHSVEEQVLGIIADLLKKNRTPLSVKAITQLYQSRYGKEHIKPITPKWIGTIIRSKLHLNTVKSNGVYIIDNSERTKLQALFERYDINTKSTVSGKAAS